MRVLTPPFATDVLADFATQVVAGFVTEADSISSCELFSWMCDSICIADSAMKQRLLGWILYAYKHRHIWKLSWTAKWGSHISQLTLIELCGLMVNAVFMHVTTFSRTTRFIYFPVCGSRVPFLSVLYATAELIYVCVHPYWGARVAKSV
jgi:hypothetical protein